MSREFEFRAWDGCEEKMLSTGQYPIYNEVDNGFHSGRSAIKQCTFLGITKHDNGDWYSLDLMQFTGLKDKNGVKIYEGDIVVDVYGQTNEIKWSTCGFWFNGLSLTEHSDQIEKGLVIGNIYETPELVGESV